MSKIICDGFEGYSGASMDQISAQWDGITNGGSIGFSRSDVRFAGSRHFYYLGGDQYLYKTIANQTRMILGLAVRGPDSMGNGHSTNFGLLDGTTYQIISTINTDGSMSLRLSSRTGTALATTAPGLVIASMYNFWEWDITFGTGTSGAVEMWKEGVSVASASGVNTGPSGVGRANLIRLGGMDNSPNVGWNRVDDLYALNTAGGAPWNARLGDSRAYPIHPSAAGSSTQFTPSSGANYQNVSDADPNDDGNYNASNTPGHRDLFACENMPSTFAGTIFAVNHYSRCKKDDAGPRTAAQVMKVGATVSVSPAWGLATAYLTKCTPRDVSPDTSAAFTKAEIDAIEIGSDVAS